MKKRATGNHKNRPGKVEGATSALEKGMARAVATECKRPWTLVKARTEAYLERDDLGCGGDYPERYRQ